MKTIKALILSLTIALFYACSTTSGVPDNDKLYIGIDKIKYSERQNDEHTLLTKEEVDAAGKDTSPLFTGGKGDWIQVSGAALSKGVKKITINGSSSKNAAVKVCAGSPTGKVIGYVPLESTAKEVTVPAVNSVTGSNNIYFVFSDDVQIDYWSLS